MELSAASNQEAEMIDPVPWQMYNFVVKLIQCFTHDVNITEKEFNFGQGNQYNGLQLHE